MIITTPNISSQTIQSIIEFTNVTWNGTNVPPTWVSIPGSSVGQVPIQIPPLNSPSLVWQITYGDGNLSTKSESEIQKEKEDAFDRAMGIVGS